MAASALLCPLCACTQLRIIETSSSPYQVFACNDCGLGFVHPMPDRKTLEAAYNEAYYEPWREQHVASRDRMWRRRLHLLEEYCPAPASLLDVGAGEGAFAAKANPAGYLVHVTEFTDSGAAEIYKKLPQAEVFIGELTELDLPEASYDVVSAWHCLEHMRDPFAALQKIYSLLKPGGTLVLAVPNRCNYLMALIYRIVKGRPYPLFSLMTKEIHLYHFTPTSLRRALEQSGFGVKYIGWDNSMVEPAKYLIDSVAALPGKFGGPLWTEAMLAVATKQMGS